MYDRTIRTDVKHLDVAADRNRTPSLQYVGMVLRHARTPHVGDTSLRSRSLSKLSFQFLYLLQRLCSAENIEDRRCTHQPEES